MVNGGQTLSCREADDPLAPGVEVGIAGDQ
jgi:hypothetical protein